MVLTPLVSLYVDEQVCVELSEEPEDQWWTHVDEYLAKSYWYHVALVEKIDCWAWLDIVEIKGLMVNLEFCTIEVDAESFCLELIVLKF